MMDKRKLFHRLWEERAFLKDVAPYGTSIHVPLAQEEMEWIMRHLHRDGKPNSEVERIMLVYKAVQVWADGVTNWMSLPRKLKRVLFALEAAEDKA